MTHHENNAEVYNKSAQKMNKKFQDMWWRTEDIERVFSYFEKPYNKLSVLEIWPWWWRDAEIFQKYTQNYLWVDISEEFIKICKKNLPELNFEVWNIQNYTFKDNIDIVYSAASLIHSDKDEIVSTLEKISKNLNKWWVVFLSMKSSEEDYEKVVLDNGFGDRTYFFYKKSFFKNLLPKEYNILYEDEQYKNNQTRFTLIIQK